MRLNKIGYLEKVRKWDILSAREGFMRLDLNESYWMIDKPLLNKLMLSNNSAISLYPDYSSFIELLSGYTKMPEENIFLTAGADNAIDLLIRLFFHEKEEIIIPSPLFSVYYHYMKIAKIKGRFLPYADKKQYFQFPYFETINSIDENVGGIILCNPSNPLGTLIEESYLIKIIERSYKLRIPVIVDEAYFEFCGKTCARYIEEFDNLIILRTFSKAFGLAGLRIGYILADKKIIESLSKIAGQWDVNGYALHCSGICLGNLGYFRSKLKDISRIKSDLERWMKSIGFQVYRSDSNFIVVKHAKSKRIIEHLKRRKILVANLSDYPHSFDLLENAIRIGIPSFEDLNKFKSSLIEATKQTSK